MAILAQHRRTRHRKETRRVQIHSSKCAVGSNGRRDGALHLLEREGREEGGKHDEREEGDAGREQGDRRDEGSEAVAEGLDDPARSEHHQQRHDTCRGTSQSRIKQDQRDNEQEHDAAMFVPVALEKLPMKVE